MRCWVPGFLVGTLWVAQLAALPDSIWHWSAGTLALVAAVAVYGFKIWRFRGLILFLVGWGAGFFWACERAQATLDHRLPAELDGQLWKVRGWVVSLPEIREKGTRFRFLTQNFQRKDTVINWQGRLLVSWYGEEAVSPGEFREILLRVSKPRASFNPGLFDYEGWLFQQGLSGRGHGASPFSLRLGYSEFIAPHHQIRAWLRNAFLRHLPESNSRSLLIALALGESAQLDSGQWRILSATGTNHLLVISGLHLGLVFSGAYLLMRKSGMPYRWSCIVACLCACLYGAISGLGMPVQRAMVMVLLTVIALATGRRIAPGDLFLMALFVVLLVNPFAPLSAGFVLSFAAVFILGYCFSGRVNNWPSKRREKRVGEGARFYIWQLCRTQWVMTLGMPGFLLASVSQLSLVSMAANLLALPVIGLLVVPSALMACLLIPVWEASGKAFAWLAYYLIEGLWYWLSMIGELNQVIPARGSSFLAVVLCVIAGMVCLLPVAFRARWLGLTLVLPILFLPLQRLNTGIARITVLDVGQGLAVLIETRQHRVLYDTGPRFSDKFDAGDQIVVPAIHLRGHGEIDELIVSHGDMDHAGGYDAVVRRLQVGRIHKGSEMDCQPHRKWEYDQIVFELTGLEDGQNSNNNSCILRLSASHHSMLIPGDIEAPGESSLVRRYRLGGFNLAADLLISPHHGSQTSSTPGFLNAVSPSAVIVSAGFQNRFGHPHQRVMYRYENRGIRILETARSGAITIELSTTGISVSEARKDHPRLWHNH